MKLKYALGVIIGMILLTTFGANLIQPQAEAILKSVEDTRSPHLLLSGQNMQKSDKKTTINIFIDRKVVQDLRSEAEIKGVSLNSNINSILKNYTNFYRRAKELQAVFITGNDFRFFLENMDEKKMLDNFKHNLTDIIPSSLEERQIPSTFENHIEHEYSQMAVNAGIIYRFTRYYDNEGLLCLLFQHHFGPKWSKMLAEGIAYQIETLFGIPTKYIISPSRAVITIVDRRFSKPN